MTKGKQLKQKIMKGFGASPEAIRHHYDVSNDFYRLWLDKTFTYSCALWRENERYDDLELAQRRKIDYHIRQARAQSVKRVLDVGCGWGSILQALIEEHDVERAVGLTLSNAQADYITAFNIPQIDIRVEGWSEHCPEGLYDAIISIGAFEHFARREQSNEEKIRGYREFFSRCHSWLKPSGWMSLQTIACGNMRREDNNLFITEEIFPESDLPLLADIAHATERIFEIVVIRNDRHDYAMTLRAWLKRLRANRKAAINLVGEELVSRYERYLRMSTFAFEVGANTLLRVTLRRIDKPRE